MNWIDPLGLEVLNPEKYPISDNVLEALKKFNKHIGDDKDIVVTGGNRPKTCPKGAGKKSQHVLGTAADIKVPGQRHIVTANQAQDSKLFGGIGWYEEGYLGPHGEGPHVHVDVRDTPARWGFDKSGKEYHGRFPSVKVK